VPVTDHVLAEYLDPAGARNEEAQKHAQRRRLAGPVAAQQRHRLAGGDCETDAGDGNDGAVVLFQAVDLDNRVLRGVEHGRKVGSMRALVQSRSRLWIH